MTELEDLGLSREMSVTERAEELGLETYDTALPQPWFDAVISMTRFDKDEGFNPSGHIVWGYSTGYWGEPIALTLAGESILGLADDA